MSPVNSGLFLLACIIVKIPFSGFPIILFLKVRFLNFLIGSISFKFLSNSVLQIFVVFALNLLFHQYLNKLSLQPEKGEVGI